VCCRMGIAERIAITKIVTAKNFPISPSLVLPGKSRYAKTQRKPCCAWMASTGCNDHPFTGHQLRT
jgi:hypothetical protein